MIWIDEFGLEWDSDKDWNPYNLQEYQSLAYESGDPPNEKQIKDLIEVYFKQKEKWYQTQLPILNPEKDFV